MAPQARSLEEARTKPPPRGIHALLALAGAIDALLFLHAGGLLAVYMTGNTSKLGQALTRADGRAAGALALVLGSFVVATTVAAWLGARSSRARAPALLGVVAGLIATAETCAGPSYGLAVVALLAAASGALNQVLPDEAGVTFVTGTLVNLGRAVSSGMTRKALSLALRWVAFLAGAVLATAADERLHVPVLGTIAGMVAFAAAATLVRAGE